MIDIYGSTVTTNIDSLTLYSTRLTVGLLIAVVHGVRGVRGCQEVSQACWLPALYLFALDCGRCVVVCRWH